MRAFSLLELAVTLAMVGILGGLVVASLSSIQERSMVRQQLEVARGSMYEWRDKSRNSHMIGCIESEDLGGNEHEITFKLMESGDCDTGTPVPGSVTSFKLVGVEQLSSQHLDSSGNVFAQSNTKWLGSFTVDGTPGGVTGLIQGIQPIAEYLASIRREGSGCVADTTGDKKIRQDSSGGFHTING